MNLFPSRGGWPFTGPPNCDFELNTNSPQAQGLVGWWPTLQNIGATVRDFSGYGNHGTLNGDCAQAGTDVVGRCLTADGTGDYVQVANSSQFNFSACEFTISLWSRCTWASVAANARLLCHGLSGGAGTRYEIYRTVAGELTFAVDDNTTKTELSCGSSFSTDWLLWTFVADSAADTIIFYLNGLSSSYKGNGTNNSIAASNDLYLFRQDPGDSTGYWLGRGADFRIYNRALAPAEVWAMYAPQTRWELCRFLVPHFPGVTLAAGGVDVSLDTLALTGAAQGLTVSPGAVNVALDALGLTAAAQSLTVQAVTTIALDALALVGAAQGLTVVPGEATTALDLLTLTGAAQGLTVSSGAVSVALDALGLTATAQGLTVSPGAVSVVLDALGLSASAETITISSGVIVALNALALSIQAESLGVSPGAVAVELASLGLTGAAQGLDILPGAVTIALDALTLASAAGPLTVSTGIRVALDALALTGTVLGTTVEPGSVGVSLDALNLTAAILALSIAAGADMIDVDVSDALVWGAAVADALLYHVEVSDTSRE